MQAIDTRDGKTYWIAKQADGNIWMTQNLDLCIGCEGVATLTSKNTDLNEVGSGAYEDGYTHTGSIITWAPISAAETSTDWSDDDYIPRTAEGNDTYVYTSGTTARDNIYNSLSECASSGHNSDLCSHYHLGNYYNWTSAIASNNSAEMSSQIAANSICPSGWKLPRGFSGKFPTFTDYDFGYLFLDSDVTTSAGQAGEYTANGFLNIRTFPLYFVRGGAISASMQIHDVSEYGKYWSSTSASGATNGAYYAHFSNRSAVSYTGYYRSLGISIRCMVR